MPRASNQTQAPRAPDKTAADVVAHDEFAGQGGSYVFDPATGTRRPADQPQHTEKE